MPVPAGKRFGDCEILGPLGAGGMGEVYRARDTSLGREVAIKVLPEQVASNPERLRRFEQEARTAGALNHPNIVTVYRFGTTDEQAPYVVTELLQGQTLRERLAQGSLGVRKAVEYALQTARGLAAAHERGIVHRDLKPENLFLTRDGLVKILDFGLAKLLSAEAATPGTAATVEVTEPGMVLGTVGYMSPEQVRGKPIDHRADLFSLGAILYEMLSGKRAFHKETSADTMSAILKEEPPELASAVRDLPPALGRIVHRCLEKDPAERFQSARDLAFNLELLSRDESGSGALAAVRESRARGWRWPALVGVTSLVAAGLGFMGSRWAVPSAAVHAPVELRRLTDFVGMEDFPAISPDGKSVAFTADVSGRRQIWVRLLNGGTPLEVTRDDADHQSPRWLPDSASLIYFTPSGDSGPGEVWEIPALGGTARPIVSSLIAGDVSHDGRHITYLGTSQGKLDLMMVDGDGGNSRALATLPGEFSYSNLRWSPDDQKVAYQSGRTFDFDAFYVPASGGEPQNITHDGNPEGGFSWLPDSSGVVFSSARGGTVLYMPVMNLWSIRLDGKELRQLTFGETSYLAPDVDRQGNIVASRRNIQFDVWKYPVDGAAQENVQRGVQITHQTGTVQTPSVSPNDRELVYLSDSGGHGNIWILNLETGQSRQLTFEQDPRVMLGVPVWSPDGAHISYVTRGHTGWNVDQWIVNPDGTNAHKISEGGGWACWSPDGRWIYVSPPTGNGFRIEKSYPDGTNRTALQADGQKPAVSSDGTLYFTRNSAAINGVSDMEILAARPENTDGRVLTHIHGDRLASTALVMQPVLSPDGKWLALLLLDAGVTDIWAQPTGGGEMRRITDFGHQATFIARRVSWSTSGKFIYAAVGKAEADIVLMRNLAVGTLR